MDDNTRQQIILAAVSTAGEKFDDETPQEYETRVIGEARRIKVMTSPQSRVSRAIDLLDECKVFPVEIVKIEKEERSKRGLITLKGRPSQFSEDGIETVRTERVDNPEGVAMVQALKPLIGHRVLIWVELEQIKGGTTKVRVIRHVEDLGEATGFDDQAADAA